MVQCGLQPVLDRDRWLVVEFDGERALGVASDVQSTMTLRVPKTFVLLAIVSARETAKMVRGGEVSVPHNRNLAAAPLLPSRPAAALRHD